MHPQNIFYGKDYKTPLQFETIDMNTIKRPGGVGGKRAMIQVHFTPTIYKTSILLCTVDYLLMHLKKI